MKWFLSLVLVLFSLSFGQTCGGEGQPICEFAPATQQGASGCQSGEFADIGTGKCWTCPAGYDRTLAPVTAANACAKAVATQSFAATKQSSVACQAGEFLDIGLNQCWQCPSGYDRTLSAVTASDACAKSIPVQSLAATKVSTVACQAGEFLDIGRNECWSCPADYNRTLSAVTASDACSRAVPEMVTPATGYGKGTGIFGTDCPSGAFLDIGLGTCWSCPAGTIRNANPVNGNAGCTVPGYTAVSSATFKRSRTCAAGQIYDAIDGGTCWTCPSGSNRTVYAVNASNACEVPASTAKSAATLKRNRTCPSGQFFDAIDGGSCWSCPTGTNRTVFAVNASNACEIPASTAESPATYKRDYPCPSGQIFDAIKGGSCWTCPAHHNRSIWPVDGSMACTIDANLTCQAGLSNIGGTCRVKDACGAENQRPCTVLERIPSCDAKLYEDFKLKKCLPVKDGESPFLAGLGSLAETVFDVRAICEDALHLFPKIQTGNIKLDGTTTCAREFGIGFLCATPTVSVDLSKAVDPAAAISQYYLSAPCNVPYTESLQPATRHGNSRLLSCPAGQFFDIIDSGSCWSCPEGWNRTLYPVNTAQACSRGEGVPELFRGFCAIGQYVLGDRVGNPLKCLDALFKDGFPVLKGDPASVDAVGRMCNLTGEFTLEYTAKLLLGATSNEKPAVRRQRLLDELAAIQTDLNSTTLVDRIANEPTCRGFLTDGSDSSTSAVRLRKSAIGIAALGHGGLRIDLPAELGLHGELRGLDGTLVREVRAPGIQLAQGTLRTGIYVLVLEGGSGAKAASHLVTVP